METTAKFCAVFIQWREYTGATENGNRYFRRRLDKARRVVDRTDGVFFWRSGTLSGWYGEIYWIRAPERAARTLGGRGENHGGKTLGLTVLEKAGPRSNCCLGNFFSNRFFSFQTFSWRNFFW